MRWPATRMNPSGSCARKSGSAVCMGKRYQARPARASLILVVRLAGARFCGPPGGLPLRGRLRPVLRALVEKLVELVDLLDALARQLDRVRVFGGDPGLLDELAEQVLGARELLLRLGDRAA